MSQIPDRHRGSHTVVVFDGGALDLVEDHSDGAIRGSLEAAYGTGVHIDVIIRGLSEAAARIIASNAPNFVGRRTRKNLLQLLSKGN